MLLGEDPQAIADDLVDTLEQGTSIEAVAAAVVRAAAVRIARFHTSNEFADWDAALHTFTFANAVHQGLRRAPSSELVRGVFDAAMSVYLDRFLNVPPARLPEPDGAAEPEALLAALPALLDHREQVNEAGELVADYWPPAAIRFASRPRSAARSSARTVTSTRSSASRPRSGSSGRAATRSSRSPPRAVRASTSCWSIYAG